LQVVFIIKKNFQINLVRKQILKLQWITQVFLNVFAETAGRMELVFERIFRFWIVLHIDGAHFNVCSRRVLRSVLSKQSTLSWLHRLLDVDVHCVEGEIAKNKI
jgi:hypothetical protein